MKRLRQFKFEASWIAFGVALLIFMNGCGSSSNNSATTSTGPLSGNWQMSLQSSDAKLNPRPQSGFLLQNGNAVTGSVFFSDNPCSGVGSVSGTVSGSDVSLAIDPVGIEVNLTGTLGAGPTMSGDYTTLSTGCTGTNVAPDTGTWTANLVAPLNGNIQGTFTSKVTDTAYAITGQLTQGANTGISNAALTGTLNIANYCLATANIVGVVSGTSVVINLTGSDGTQIGQISATTSLDGTTLAGTYNIARQGSGSTKPCTGGDNGTVSFTL